jgi:hypothetical protein
MEWIKTYVAQFAGLLAAFIVGWGASHGLTLDAGEISALIVAAFVVVERLIAAHTNPTNAATPRARAAAKVMLEQHGEPSVQSAMRSGAGKAGPVRKDD